MLGIQILEGGSDKRPQKYLVCLLSRVWLFETPRTVACQAPLSMGFPRQEYWSGLLFPPPGGLPHAGTESTSPALVGRFFTIDHPGSPTLLQSYKLPACEAWTTIWWLFPANEGAWLEQRDLIIPLPAFVSMQQNQKMFTILNTESENQATLLTSAKL